MHEVIKTVWESKQTYCDNKTEDSLGMLLTIIIYLIVRFDNGGVELCRSCTIVTCALLASVMTGDKTS